MISHTRGSRSHHRSSREHLERLVEQKTGPGQLGELLERQRRDGHLPVAVHDDVVVMDDVRPAAAPLDVDLHVLAPEETASTSASRVFSRPGVVTGPTAMG